MVRFNLWDLYKLCLIQKGMVHFLQVFSHACDLFGSQVHEWAILSLLCSLCCLLIDTFIN